MSRRTTRWFLSLSMALYLLLVFVQGNQDADEAYKNGRHLVLEYFLPINPATGESNDLSWREKRDVEGSGEDDALFGEVDKDEETSNGTQTEKFHDHASFLSSLSNVEGSGDVDKVNENDIFRVSSSEDEVPVISESESLTTETAETEVVTEVTSTEMIFDKSEDFGDGIVETTTTATTPPVILDTTTVDSDEEDEKIQTDDFPEEISTKLSREEEFTTTTRVPVTVLPTETTDVVTVIPGNIFKSDESVQETTTEGIKPTLPVAVPHDMMENIPKTETTAPTVKEITEPPDLSFSRFPAEKETLEVAPTTPEPIAEEIFKESIRKNIEAGNILQKQNLSLAADPLLITNTRLIDSEETVQLSSPEPKRLGAYIIIGLILLSFSSLVGYITFRRRMNRKRLEFESNQESNDTEKALLSLSDYKDSSELEENHLKNNEITPIVVKSNSQINKFEKNTNFSSPKNLNTTANEKNIEKDNVLKSTAENLTQVIIEGSPKDVEEEKNAPNMEKLIVKTRIDQDSIPKKPIIINRSSTGYVPIPQDNV